VSGNQLTAATQKLEFEKKKRQSPVNLKIRVSQKAGATP